MTPNGCVGKHGKRCSIWGHEACANRLTRRAGFNTVTPETELPAGVRAHAIGSPRRQEQPLLDSLAPGARVRRRRDRDRRSPARLGGPTRGRAAHALVSQRFIPTLKPLLELDAERVLVTHGEPVLESGSQKLASALRSQPWNRRGVG